MKPERPGAARAVYQDVRLKLVGPVDTQLSASDELTVPYPKANLLTPSTREPTLGHESVMLQLLKCVVHPSRTVDGGHSSMRSQSDVADRRARGSHHLHSADSIACCVLKGPATIFGLFE